jgi:hypothetical protein
VNAGRRGPEELGPGQARASENKPSVVRTALLCVSGAPLPGHVIGSVPHAFAAHAQRSTKSSELAFVWLVPESRTPFIIACEQCTFLQDTPESSKA